MDEARAAHVLPIAAPSLWADLAELAKLRLNFLVVFTTAAGFLLAEPAPVRWALLVHAVLGTVLLAAGAAALNQVVERERDALMRRTADRPIPAGRVEPFHGLLFGVGLGLLGMAYLALAVNWLTALLGALTLAIYVFVYTPLKRHSSLATIVGAIPGAIPPMMGVTAATGAIGLLGWALFGVLFFWQMPHFLAIAWLYRSDYTRGGFPVLTAADPSGERTARQMILYAAALLPVSLLPAVLGISGLAYLVGALLMGLGFLACAIAFAKKPDAPTARRVLLVSVLYLPVLLLMMVLGRTLG